jgi:circadian clock protein KaiC
MLLIGGAGAGKSSVAVQYAVAAAERGERTVAFIFDERLHTLLARSRGLGLSIDRHIRDGMLVINQIDPASLTPGEFVALVRRSVEQDGARVVLIDSLNGYLNAMPGEKFLLIQMHELLTYLTSRGVLTIMVMAQHGMIGNVSASPVELSYLADTVLVLRYFEHAGRVRKAISVMKKRGGKHEETIRELRLDSTGVHVGEPLTEFDGVLSGTPQYRGADSRLLRGGISGPVDAFSPDGDSSTGRNVDIPAS